MFKDTGCILVVDWALFLIAFVCASLHMCSMFFHSCSEESLLGNIVAKWHVHSCVYGGGSMEALHLWTHNYNVTIASLVNVLYIIHIVVE